MSQFEMMTITPDLVKRKMLKHHQKKSNCPNANTKRLREQQDKKGLRYFENQITKNTHRSRDDTKPGSTVDCKYRLRFTQLLHLVISFPTENFKHQVLTIECLSFEFNPFIEDINMQGTRIRHARCNFACIETLSPSTLLFQCSVIQMFTQDARLKNVKHFFVSEN